MSDATPVSPMDPAKKNSTVEIPSETDSTVIIDTASNVCHWNDAEFTEGDRVASEDGTYECSFGKWVKI